MSSWLSQIAAVLPNMVVFNFFVLFLSSKNEIIVELRDEIIRKTFLQFLSKGYHATSLKELEQVTGPDQGGFLLLF